MVKDDNIFRDGSLDFSDWIPWKERTEWRTRWGIWGSCRNEENNHFCDCNSSFLQINFIKKIMYDTKLPIYKITQIIMAE